MPRKVNIMLGSSMFFCHISIDLHYQLSRVEIRGGWLKSLYNTRGMVDYICMCIYVYSLTVAYFLIVKILFMLCA